MTSEERTVLSEALYADDGTELIAPLPAQSLPPFPHHIGPVDVVGSYEFDATIGWWELDDIIEARRTSATPERDAADLAALKVPNGYLFAGWCIDVFPEAGATDEEIAASWDAVYAGLRLKAARELAVRRELRARRIGVDMSLPPRGRRVNGVLRAVRLHSMRCALPGVEEKARELCIAAGSNPDELFILTDAPGVGWERYVRQAMRELGLEDPDLGPEWSEVQGD